MITLHTTTTPTRMHRGIRWASVLACTALLCGSALAAKPEWAGNGKKQKHEEASSTVEVRVGSYFEPRQRDAVTEYYGKQRAAGHCPPGLAKKNNGCMPPGQAKKWAVGQRLPSTVVLYPIPREVQIRIGVPPAGYRYVRTANDILLIAIGTMIVVDAIEDLMKL